MAERYHFGNIKGSSSRQGLARVGMSGCGPAKSGSDLADVVGGWEAVDFDLDDWWCSVRNGRSALRPVADCRVTGERLGWPGAERG